MQSRQSFFQKLSDSFTSIFPFNSTAKELPNVSQVSFDKHLSPIRYPSNRRLASEAFGKDDEDIKIKRARLHHDPMTLPSSRIIKQSVHVHSEKNMLYNNNFNDAASDFSDISVSTSGVSSLHPRSSKRMIIGQNNDSAIQSQIKYPRNLNLSQKIVSPMCNKSLRNTNEFMSSPARKILEKLDRLTTPVTAADRLNSIIGKERHFHMNNTKQINSPYSRPLPPICGKKQIPIKAVTVSATSDLAKKSCGPIRREKMPRYRKIGFVDDIDLDSENTNDFANIPKLNDSAQVDFSNLPLLKKSMSNNSEDLDLVENRERSPDLDFTFRSPTTVNDEEYHSQKSREATIMYQFKSKITTEEMEQYDKRRENGSDKKIVNLWRCDTCYMENTEDSSECTNCGNLSTKNKNPVVLLEKSVTGNNDRCALIRKMLEKDNGKTDTDNVKPVVSLSQEFNTASSVNSSSTFSFGNKLEPTSEIKSDVPKFGSAPITSDSKSFGFGILSSTSSSSTSSNSTNISLASKLEFKTSLASSTISTPSITNESISLSTNEIKKPIFDTSVPPPMFGFGEKSSNPSTSAFAFGQPLSNESKNSEIVTSSSLTTTSFGKVSLATSISTQSTNPLSSDPIKSSLAFTFGAVSSKAETDKFGISVSTSSTPFTFNQSTVSEAQKSIISESLSKTEDSNKFGNIKFNPSGDAFSFGQTSKQDATKTSLTFGQTSVLDKSSTVSLSQLSGNDLNKSKTITSISSTTFSFGQDKNTKQVDVSSSNPSTLMPFGQKSNIEPNKPANTSSFTFNQTTVQDSNKPMALFGQTSNVADSNKSSTAPFTFGQTSVNESNKTTTTTFSLGMTSTNETNKTSSTTPFAFGQSLGNETNKPSTTAPFAFVQTSSNETSKTLSAAPYAFGQAPSSEASKTSSIGFGFGQASNIDSNKASTASTFAFGQTSGTESNKASTASTFAFGQTSGTESNKASTASTFAFGQTSGTESNKVSSAASFAFGQSVVSESNKSIPAFQLGKTSINESNKAPTADFSFGQTSNDSNKPSGLFGQAGVSGVNKPSPFFGQNVAETDKPSSFFGQSSGDNSKQPGFFGQTKVNDINKPSALFGQSTQSVSSSKTSSTFLFGLTSSADSEKPATPQSSSSSLFTFGKQPDPVIAPIGDLNKSNSVFSVQPSTGFTFGKVSSASATTNDTNKQGGFGQASISDKKPNSSKFTFTDNTKSSTASATNSLFSGNSAGGSNGNLFGSNTSQSTNSSLSTNQIKEKSDGFSFSNTTNMFNSKTSESTSKPIFGINNSTSSSSGPMLSFGQSVSSSASLVGSNFMKTSTSFGGSNNFNGGGLFNSQPTNSVSNTPMFGSSAPQTIAPSVSAPVFNSNAMLENNAASSDNMFNFNSKTSSVFTSNINPNNTSNPFEFNSGNKPAMGGPSLQANSRRLIKSRRRK